MPHHSIAAAIAGSLCEVLVFEDNRVDAMLLESALDFAPINVTFCSDGRQAWNLVNVIEPPDLVLLNISLPHINGLELLKHIKSKRPWRKVPVVVISGENRVNKIKAIIELGLHDFIHKPYDVRRLRNDLERLLNCLSGPVHA